VLSANVYKTFVHICLSSGGSRKKYLGPGPSSFGRQQRLSEITIELISYFNEFSFRVLGKIWGAVPLAQRRTATAVCPQPICTGRFRVVDEAFLVRFTVHTAGNYHLSLRSQLLLTVGTTSERNGSVSLQQEYRIFPLDNPPKHSLLDIPNAFYSSDRQFRRVQNLTVIIVTINTNQKTKS